MDKRKKNLLVYGGLLLFGLVSAIVLVTPHWLTVENGWIPEWRCKRLEYGLNTFREAGKFDFSHLSHTIGYVLYFPILMSKFNILSGYDMFCIAQSVSGGIVIMLYPLLMYKLFHSEVLALISPIIIQFTFGDLLYIDKASEYWSGLWLLALAFPLLFLFMKENNERKRTVITICMALIMALSNVLRGSSGLPVLLVFFMAIGILFLQKKIKLKRVCIYVLICLLSFNLLGTTIPDAVADKWGYNGKLRYNSSPWFEILIGMGYIENDYGLYYSDDSCKEYIGKLYPDLVYNSEEFHEACEKEALKIIKENPGFVIKGWFMKLGKCFQLWAEYILGNSKLTYYWHPYIFILFALLISSILLMRQKKFGAYMKEQGTWLVLCALAVFFSLYAGILGYPHEYYIWGSLGGLGIFLVLMCYSMIAYSMKKE